MKKAEVFVHDITAGIFAEIIPNSRYEFTYHDMYQGAPVSLTMPCQQKKYLFKTFPPFFEGLLPEGIMLEGMLRQLKIDRQDYFAQLIATGEDLVGAITVKLLVDE